MRQPVDPYPIGLYPGTFDPVHMGHMDIIQRSTKFVGKLIVAVASNAGKSPMFTIRERFEMVQEEIGRLKNPRVEIEVRVFDGLLVRFMKKVKANILIRGLRAVSDYEYEFQMARMNHQLDPKVETLFLMASDRYQFVASRVVKEVSLLGGDVHPLVGPRVAARLAERFAAQRETSDQLRRDLLRLQQGEDVTLRPYTKADQAGVMDLILGILSEEFSLASDAQPDLTDIRGVYQRESGQFWVSMMGNKVIGTVGLQDIGSGQAALRRMFVHADYRGQKFGVARKLFDAMRAHAAEHGVTRIWLSSASRFAAANRFYEKQGFATVDKTKIPRGFPRVAKDSRYYRLDL
ncbi:MAG: pantetheine-phosphate adenylyltransferase [Alphaproteobacteria bacterium]|nr:MAG: pantetheine-phosphate adenylyltransferase [Alphaproteobacteria bacterium]